MDSLSGFTMRYRLSTLLLIVTLSAIAIGVAARYYNRPSNTDVLIEHMEALPSPCTYKQVEEHAKKLNFELTLLLGNDDWSYWGIEQRGETPAYNVLHTQFRNVNSRGELLLGDWQIWSPGFRVWGGEQIWPEKPTP